MPKTDAFQEKLSKCSKGLTLSNNCKFVRSSKITVQLKMQIDVWQSIFDQLLQTNP